MSKKRQSFPHLDREVEEKIADWFKEQEMLYRPDAEGYSNREMKNAIWAEGAQLIGIEGEIFQSSGYFLTPVSSFWISTKKSVLFRWECHTMQIPQVGNSMVYERYPVIISRGSQLCEQNNDSDGSCSSLYHHNL